MIYYAYVAAAESEDWNSYDYNILNAKIITHCILNAEMQITIAAILKMFLYFIMIFKWYILINHKIIPEYRQSIL